MLSAVNNKVYFRGKAALNLSSVSQLTEVIMNFPDKLLNWGVWRSWICELRWDGMHPIENANKEIFLLKFSPNGGIRQAITTY